VELTFCTIWNLTQYSIHYHIVYQMQSYSTYFPYLYSTYLIKEYNFHLGFEISILRHQHQCAGEMVLQDSSTQFVTWTWTAPCPHSDVSIWKHKQDDTSYKNTKGNTSQMSHIRGIITWSVAWNQEFYIMPKTTDLCRHEWTCSCLQYISNDRSQFLRWQQTGH